MNTFTIAVLQDFEVSSDLQERLSGLHKFEIESEDLKVYDPYELRLRILDDEEDDTNQSVKDELIDLLGKASGYNYMAMPNPYL